jgi:hypothetical protein
VGAAQGGRAARARRRLDVLRRARGAARAAQGVARLLQGGPRGFRLGGREWRLVDLLFTLASLARHEDVDPEQALQAANRKFLARFRYVEEALAREGARPAPERRDRMEALWEEAKAALRRTSPARIDPSGGTSGSAPRPAPPPKSA